MGMLTLDYILANSPIANSVTKWLIDCPTVPVPEIYFLSAA
jgi:hypothetical protein